MVEGALCKSRYEIGNYMLHNSRLISSYVNNCTKNLKWTYVTQVCLGQHAKRLELKPHVLYVN